MASDIHYIDCDCSKYDSYGKNFVPELQEERMVKDINRLTFGYLVFCHDFLFLSADQHISDFCRDMAKDVVRLSKR